MQAWYEKRKNVAAIVLLMLFAFVLYRFDGVMDALNKALAILSPFFLGGLLAILVNLPMRVFEKVVFAKFKSRALLRIKRPFSLILSILLVSAVLVLTLLVIIPEMHNAIESTIRALPAALRAFIDWINGLSDNLRANLNLAQPAQSEVQDQFESIYRYLIGGISNSTVIIKSAAGAVIDTIIAFIFALYLLNAKEKLHRQFKRLMNAIFDEKHSNRIMRVFDISISTFSGFIAGQCTQAIISACLTFVALTIFNIPFAILIALLVFVTSFIPFFGPYISGLFGAILVFSQRADMVGWFLIVFFVIQQLAGSVIFPRIMSDAIDLPSIWVLVAVTVGGGIMGIAGMIIFIPFMSVAYRLTSEFVRLSEQKKREGKQ